MKLTQEAKLEETKTYWNGNGKHQELYNAQWDELVPATGKAGTMQGEVLRAAGRLYYRWFNDGDRIEEYGTIIDSTAENAWGFLHQAHTLLPDGEGKNALKAIAEIASDAASADTEDEYEKELERLADAAILYAATRPLVPTDEDMVDGKWEDHCIDVCYLQPYNDEYDEGYDWEDDEEGEW